ncbi:MAG: family 16 glycosylhydrolase [Candidatus Absconditabacterales bacterium]|jgi:beta-glucanase (GH16 family)
MKQLTKKVMIILIIIIITNRANAQPYITTFFDHFEGTTINAQLWYIPTWHGNGDGTWIGRTQFRCVPAALPPVNNSETSINFDLYNPTGFSFYGTDLISNRRFSPGNGLIFTIRAKIKTPMIGGIVGGIFLYDLTNGTNHDEIDFEMILNQPNSIHTNIYSNESLGIGHPDSSSIKNDVTQYHTYTIQWLPNKVVWLIDDSIVRVNIDRVPVGPMRFHLNMWAPNTEWPSAYNEQLQPTNDSKLNKTYSMVVDFVKVDSLKDASSSIAPQIKVENNFNFYPNPAKEVIHLDLPSKTVTNIYDITGKLLISKKDIIKGDMPISDLKPGVYLIVFQTEISTNKKLIIY